jgi:hypothetical protein
MLHLLLHRGLRLDKTYALLVLETHKERLQILQEAVEHVVDFKDPKLFFSFNNSITILNLL